MGFSPKSSVESASMIQAYGSVRLFINAGLGSLVVILRVRPSASIFAIFRSSGALSFISMVRCSDFFTASASQAFPFWNVIPSLSFISYVSLSSESVKLSARKG